MRNLLSFLLVTLLSFTLATDLAEAKRFGGGSSLGKQRHSYSRQAAPQTPPASPSPQQAFPRPASNASRWLGPLAGLVAGGLLASLLFGDAFQGLQIFDLLLLGGMGVGAYLLFRSFRQKSASPVTSHRYAGVAASGPNFQIPEIGSGLGQRPRTNSAAAFSIRPTWFNEETFLEAAKTHFTRLQTAWDAGNMAEIESYTTPALFAELTRERAQLGNQRQFTEVVDLDTELLDLISEGDQIIASVRFSGLIREEEQGKAQPFSEVWHVERSLTDPQANWYVAGIQQS
jgi:predicted lipid-binding transport protein (Tim44 family)